MDDKKPYRMDGGKVIRTAVKQVYTDRLYRACGMNSTLLITKYRVIHVMYYNARTMFTCEKHIISAHLSGDSSKVKYLF